MSELFPVHAPPEDDEARVLLRDVPWSTYVVLSDSIDSRGIHLTYLDGLLEIMTKSSRHEVSKKQIARLVEMFCLELDIPLYGFGEMTLREEGKKRGLEPDEWYCRGKEREPPELALEVVVGNPLLDKLEVYRGLGIREVWVYKAKKGQFEIFTLRRGRYVTAEKSAIIPELDLSRVAHYLAMPDQHEALKAFRDELRETR